MNAETRTALALVLMFGAACFATMAAGFGYEVMHGRNPITPELYGDRVYRIPAIVWVGIQEKAGLIALLGAMLVAGRSRWMQTGAGLACVGYAILTGLFALFCVYAADAQQGRLMFYLCLACGVPMTLAGAGLSAWIWTDLRRRIANGGAS